MRPLEFLLSVTVVIWLLHGYFSKPENKIAGRKAGAALSVLFLLLHLLFEGIRWQLMPIYLLLLILSIITVKTTFKNKTIIEARQAKIKRTLTIGAGLIYCIVALLLPSVVPVFELPEPSGPHAVGSFSRHLIDENRIEPLGDSDSYRELMIEIYYPAQASTDRKPEYTMFPYREWGGALSAFLSIPDIFFHHLTYVKSFVLNDAVIIQEPEKLPVLFYSHGAGGSRFQNYALMQELASHGYMVVSIDHTYDAAQVLFSGERKVNSVFIGLAHDEFDHDANIRIRAEDAIFILDWLNIINEADPKNVLTNRLDIDRVGFVGHSYGGATAAQTLALDPRFKAGINFDGALFGTSIDLGLDQPFMLVHAERSFNYDPSDRELEAAGMSREEFNEMMEDTYNKSHLMFNEGMRDEGYFVMFDFGDHMSFSDMYFLSPLLSRGYNLHEFHDYMNRITVSFFDAYLKREVDIDLENIINFMEGVSINRKRSSD